MEKDIAKILISEDEIRSRVRDMGKQITADYQGSSLIMVGILRGAVLFFGDLAKEIKVPLSMDFMAVSSYGDSTKTSGVVRIIHDLHQNIEGKDVLIVEDIIDTGLTLHYLIENLRSRNPKSIKTCCLLDKPSRRRANVTPDYVGFEVPDEFVVGYGLDYKELYRNLPYIGVLKPDIYAK
ncbi:hypoxanthine phosphoribosyltransferase [Clostridium thermosuccinogenes]|uniref:Hypoxanthine phosphoribosyltransferase n=1 Tax=Clostridium thermosuccinogenes TaxID=84032 RepID=A0A2K2FE10_9CLOT|nr:hypoxanthine phosphoribosyltransferase [Pseudoclostridium thermosuccinogenes]AUS95796.1 hypoxanthine phosphoribosyltransferase [Pseudoclostridium thermosuccinogenes]PNT95748.1 hypoxanthine phosphoribosyltransferase [Pseudoclostridium thermosuccinogenes]PNT97032.1 hypoxanthine phosphoribosyltransferase [Pseudoclostridium thermosuccinogenes]